MKTNRSFPALIFVVVLGIGAALAYAMHIASADVAAVGILAVSFVLAYGISSSIQVADQWSKAVVLRLGKFRSLEGPGLFLIIPLIETIPYWLDIRVLTSSFKAEKTLTKDTVPVDVDAVLFWKIVDPKKAALDVADYQSAISWASQTALRDVIGKTMLCDMLEGRDKISDSLRKIIDERTEPWGINVISVEVKDVLIPPALENAMSMQAQAERERQARVILGDSERQVSGEIRRSRQDLCQRSSCLSFEGYEHAVRRLEAKLNDRHCSQLRHRNDAIRRPCWYDSPDHGIRPGTQGQRKRKRSQRQRQRRQAIDFCLVPHFSNWVAD